MPFMEYSTISPFNSTAAEEEASSFCASWNSWAWTETAAKLMGPQKEMAATKRPKRLKREFSFMFNDLKSTDCFLYEHMVYGTAVNVNHLCEPIHFVRVVWPEGQTINPLPFCEW